MFQRRHPVNEEEDAVENPPGPIEDLINNINIMIDITAVVVGEGDIINNNICSTIRGNSNITTISKMIGRPRPSGIPF